MSERYTPRHKAGPVTTTGPVPRLRGLLGVVIGLTVGLIVGGGAVYAVAAGDTIACQPGQVIVLRANNTWACVADPAVTPSPSPSVSPSASPSASPSPSATTPPPSPSASPTPSPTPTPSPSPTGLLKNCFTQLAACGYPHKGNTGVPSGTTLTAYTGNLNPPAGMVIDGKSIGCGLTIRNQNIVIKNSKITGPCFYGVDMEGGSLTIQDSTVDCVDHKGTGIAYANYTALRVQVVNCENGFHTSGNNRVEDSYIGGVVEVNGGHGDGIQGTGGSNYTIRHNTFDLFNPITSSIIWDNQTMNNVLVENNFFAAGAFTVYVPTGGSNVVYRNNRFYGPVGNWTSDPHRPAYGYSTGANRSGVVWTGNFRDYDLGPVGAA